MPVIIENFTAFQGEHCETTAMGNLLRHNGIHLSEPMLFGIGQGLGFIYWDSKSMDFPFIGGRVKPDELSACIASRLNLDIRIQETSSMAKAWRNVQDYIELGVPVGLKLDSYYLDYFTQKIHFAAHYAVIYGFDEENAYMSDTAQQRGQVRTGLSSLAEARNARGSMSSRNRSFTLMGTDRFRLDESIIRAAIAQNAHQYLHPPIRNIGNSGIEKMSVEILNWPARSKELGENLMLTALLMERAGTGGALFRNLYRDFLKECLERFADNRLEQAFIMFTEIAPMWSRVSELIDLAGRTGSPQELRFASELLVDIAKNERTAMGLLLNIVDH
jgi:hypothetical protein